MKRMITILICSLAVNLFAADFTPFAASASAPLAKMESVNNVSFMSSGSTYSSDIYDIDASAPSSNGRSVRKAGGPGTPSGESTDYDPNNPQFSPIGDAVLPLLALAILYEFLFLHFRRRQACRISQAEF